MNATDLSDRWRTFAADLRRFGQEPLAVMAESFAAELEEWWRGWWHEELTYDEAQRETGIPRSTIEMKALHERDAIRFKKGPKNARLWEVVE